MTTVVSTLWGITPIRWTLIALITVALWMGIAKLATGSAHEVSRAAVTLASGGAESIGTFFGETIPHTIQHWHKVAGTKWCHYPKVNWDHGCIVDPNAQPFTKSREQDDGSDDPNYCPSFGQYDSYSLGDGACKVDTAGKPAETAFVPSGWRADYWTGTAEAKANAGEEITTTTATFWKVK